MAGRSKAGKLTEISVDAIAAHPNNLRKNLGDLTELVESIKAQGIMQNLTVVPGEEAGTYTAVIGHRRLAAAKEAGLDRVPAVIAEMDEREQIATMLLENIQRAELTLAEQAHGFQMMMDLGESVESIAGKSGFSETTIRGRLKLAAFPAEAFEAAQGRGATLTDFAEIASIKDESARKNLLSEVGTNGFRWSLERAKKGDEMTEYAPAMFEAARTFATEITDTDGLGYLGCYTASEKSVKKLEDYDAKEDRQYFFRRNEMYLYLYENRTEADAYKDAAEEAAKQKEGERREALEDATDTAYACRKNFMMTLTASEAKKNAGVIMRTAACGAVIKSIGASFEEVSEILGCEEPDDDREIGMFAGEEPARLLAAAIWSGLDRENGYLDWRCAYAKNEQLDILYDMLTELGYVTSDEEAALKDGTHALYGEA